GAVAVGCTRFFFSSRRRHTRFSRDWSSDVCSSDLNLVAGSWGRANLRAGDEVVLTVAEHHANLLPWQRLRDELGVVLRFVGLTPEQRVDLDALEAALGPRTRLVTTFHMSNVLGAI